jgi:hypothetical protein
MLAWVFLSFFFSALSACAAEPARETWIINQIPGDGAGRNLARVAPEVHSVKTLDRYVELESSGLSVYYFGPFQTPVNPVERLRQFCFRLPRRPEPETGEHVGARPDWLGVFVNGVPISNLFEGGSYQGKNLWRVDPLAAGDDGTWTVVGRPRTELTHGFAPGLIERLVADSSGHSPIIGYAFDGYPIYGPWGFADSDGGLRRMRSSYRLRSIRRRTQWPDGLTLTPGQYGPDVSAEYPLGTFVEDYEYAPGSGDLDEFNGRFTKTPEYPNGVYAYFLSTDGQGRLTFPYLLTGRYYGKLSADELNDAARDAADRENASASRQADRVNAATIAPLDPAPAGTPRLRFTTNSIQIVAGSPTRLNFQALDARGAPIRHLEYAHERPMHLIVVSEDLSEFDHIHPALSPGDRYEVTHTFLHGGRYYLYADFTAPGFAPRVERFEITATGGRVLPKPLRPDAALTKRNGGLLVALSGRHMLRSGEDVELKITLRDERTGENVTDLEPYLGAWAHFILLDQSRRNFIHAHPLAGEIGAISTAHVHGAESSPTGPPPAEIRLMTVFPGPGLYKIWAQFQRGGRVITQPFTLRVAPAKPRGRDRDLVPPSAVRIGIGARGFEPAVLKIDSNKPVRLAVTRASAPNCGARIVFPSLGIERDLPLGRTVMIDLPPLAPGELRFTCGMGMYRGSVVVQ